MDSVHIPDLIQGGWRSLEFAPFRDGIDVAWIKKGEPALAVLRYAAGAEVPLHLHTDVEMILVLEGSQSDDNGTYTAGDLVVNAKDSKHRVFSTDGCVVLLNWSKPVAFL